ncbi:PilT/PilU family type 4a pilus ATPase [Thioalkalivibrio thiocyanodenitrificans]|uniref:PilT/PilU family type 4a pilus ATPase n=1 Tax=Thioalkalivibrio thiocyanodenitrificans TaxID=243063 RepID=UPI000379A9AC|nr:PilT/PilU family type 4a pilus ATPase [Thioalkalivibrio thiocyanodenitrificans]
MQIEPYLKLMVKKEASDLFFTVGAPASVKVEGEMRPMSRQPLAPGAVRDIAYELLDERKIEEFERTREMNIGISVEELGRFRVNIYMQRGEVSMVIRYIKSDVPTIEQLHLPVVLKDLVLGKNGLVIVAGSTGSGKSTSLASMIDYRNAQTYGHILTVEDPIEYSFTHRKSIVGQREVGLDTMSYENALREAMREAPDVIMIGEIRDLKTMEAALSYADTGHLVLSTIHAVNANQALDRIINFFPPDSRRQILMDLSLNIKGIMCQRLVTTKDGTRLPATEVLLNTPYISELIRKGEVSGIKEIIGKGASVGMHTFDQSLFELHKAGTISLQEALAKADSRGDLEWRIHFGGGVKATKEADDSLQMPSDVVTPPPAESARPPATHFDDLKPLSESGLDKDE